MIIIKGLNLPKVHNQFSSVHRVRTLIKGIDSYNFW
jgi:hypothetical protein